MTTAHAEVDALSDCRSVATTDPFSDEEVESCVTWSGLLVGLPCAPERLIVNLKSLLQVFSPCWHRRVTSCHGALQTVRAYRIGLVMLRIGRFYGDRVEGARRCGTTMLRVISSTFNVVHEVCHLHAHRSAAALADHSLLAAASS